MNSLSGSKYNANIKNRYNPVRMILIMDLFMPSAALPHFQVVDFFRKALLNQLSELDVCLTLAWLQKGVKGNE